VERRRRAAIRRRRVLIGIALTSLVAGVSVGARHGGAGESGSTGFARRAGAGQAEKPVLVHSKAPVPVLMYHVIADAPAGARLPQLYVDPATFSDQANWLASHGYTAVTLDEVYDAWFKDAEIPEKPIVLSFDDGYRGDYVFARRTLQQLHWPGDLNLLLSNLGDELSNQQVEQLIQDGWEVDSHTISHLDLTHMKPARLQREVAGSRAMLQRTFHQPVDFFCYPAGRFDPAAVQAVRSAGYLGATTELPGLASRDDMFKLHRIRVDGSDGVNGLASKLSAASG
jgi:peptidoglycan/xylan/chitin deacetylase (PgdA/CDA1 family)